MKYLIPIFLTFNILALTPKEKEVLSATKEVGGKLKKALMSGMKKGPANAVTVCNGQAPGIKNTQRDFTVARVSTKNRNPKNTPKKWMKDYIEKFHEGEIKQDYIFTSLGKNKKGFLMPIKTGGLCLQCHGTNISPAVQSKINTLYPHDKATGYKAGEIRGFFWTEFMD